MLHSISPKTLYALASCGSFAEARRASRLASSKWLLIASRELRGNSVRIGLVPVLAGSSYRLSLGRSSCSAREEVVGWSPIILRLTRRVYIWFCELVRVPPDEWPRAMQALAWAFYFAYAGFGPRIPPLLSGSQQIPSGMTTKEATASGTAKGNGNSRFPSGMTTKKATASGTAKVNGNSRFPSE